ncbi:MAG: four helix bundle protein [Phycisphaerae bacterium]|nr:four helix bundle protein [Phycisphaerae bacterium]
MDRNELKRRTKEFAHRCVKLSASLQGDYLSRHICSQLIRSSTSVAANYRAACIAHSQAAFLSKLSIVIEEVNESAFWMEFLLEEGRLRENLASHLLKEASELTAIFIASRKTLQTKNNNNQ